MGVIILVTLSLSFRHADRFLTVDGVGTYITLTVVLTRYCWLALRMLYVHFQGTDVKFVSAILRDY